MGRPRTKLADDFVIKEFDSIAECDREFGFLATAHQARCAGEPTRIDPLTIRLPRRLPMTNWLESATGPEFLEMRYLLLQLLSRLHSAGICHRDCHRENIVLDKGLPVLIDFELAIECDPNTPCYDLVGPASGITLPDQHQSIGLFAGVWWDSPFVGMANLVKDFGPLFGLQPQSTNASSALNVAPVDLVIPDPDDFQMNDAYRAQSDVVRITPVDYLMDLAAAAMFAGLLRQGEGVEFKGPYRAGYLGRPDCFHVDRDGSDEDRTGHLVPDPLDATKMVEVVEWPKTYSHYNPDLNEIVLGGKPAAALTHALLLVHEVAHVTVGFDHKHGPVWATEFLRLTKKYLPHMHAKLSTTFKEHGVKAADG
jgi:Phosphotransferase enzyme family